MFKIGALIVRVGILYCIYGILYITNYAHVLSITFLNLAKKKKAKLFKS
jgi:hypothetical protein